MPTIIPIHDHRSAEQDPIVAIVHDSRNIEALKAYRSRYGCTLREAVEALNWQGNRFVRLSEIDGDGLLQLAGPR